jgi:hypothetical protein
MAQHEQDDERNAAATPDPRPLNREERRRREFGPTGAETGAVPTDEPGAPAQGVVRTANQGELGVSGAGTGGATETGSRLPHHEGMHLPNRPNG